MGYRIEGGSGVTEEGRSGGIGEGTEAEGGCTRESG